MDAVQVCLDAESVTLFCAYAPCGKEFIPTNRRQRFHNAKCRVAAHRDPGIAFRRAQRNTRFLRLTRDCSLDTIGYRGCGGTPVSGVPDSADITILEVA